MKDGAERYRMNRERGIIDRAIHIVDGPYIDHMAKLAEIWVAAKHGWPYIDRDRPDDGWDIIMVDRKKVNVKWTKYGFGCLISPRNMPLKSDYYILVTGETEEEFVERGWATREELRSQIIDLGYGPTFGLYQSQLHPMSDFPY